MEKRHGGGAELWWQSCGDCLWPCDNFEGLKAVVKSRTVVVHAFNLSTWEAEAGRFLSLMPAWSTKWVPGQPELHRETLSQSINQSINQSNSFQISPDGKRYSEHWVWEPLIQRYLWVLRVQATLYSSWETGVKSKSPDVQFAIRSNDHIKFIEG